MTISWRTVGLGTVAYVVASFLVQAASHFGINSAHFASISFMRAEPIMWMGVGTMVVQGAVLSGVFSVLDRNGSKVRNAVGYAWAMGLFLGSYIAVVEPSKYTVPSVGSWVAVEGIAAAIQFTLFGVLLGMAHRRPHQS